jgi:hypothetical protein
MTFNQKNLDVNFNKLEKLINNFKKKEKMPHNIAGAYVIKKIMKMSPNNQIEHLGNYALDFKNYQNTFLGETEKYEKYLEILPMKTPPMDKRDYLKTLQRKSNLTKKLVSLRVLDDMGMLKKKVVNKEQESIYGLAFSEYIRSSGLSKKDALRVAIAEVLQSENDNYSYRILGEEAFLESISLKTNIKENNYSIFFNAGEELIEDFSFLSEEEKCKAIEEHIFYDLVDDGLTLISEKLRQEYFNMDIFNNKIKKYYEK